MEEGELSWVGNDLSFILITWYIQNTKFTGVVIWNAVSIQLSKKSDGIYSYSIDDFDIHVFADEVDHR